MRALRLGGSVVVAIVAGAVFAMPAAAATVTVAAADNSDSGVSYPFGIAGPGTSWTPYMGFVYKNVPAFSLAAGDTVAFDAFAVNDYDIHLSIGMAPAASNGSDMPAGAYTQVVPNTETPASPRGNTTAGDFDLKFTATAPFVFPGGGLILRFSDPAGSFASDNTSNFIVHGAYDSDPSGFFVSRFYRDTDGVFPYDHSEANGIASFRVTTAPTAVTPPGLPPDTTKPVLGALRLSPPVFPAAKSGPSASATKRVGTRVSYRLSEASSVRFTVERRSRGRKVGKRCLVPTKSNIRKKPCIRWVKVKGSFTRAGKAGNNHFRFRGRIGGKRLKLGAYRLDGRATDPAKNKSKLRRRGFRIHR